MHVAESLPAKLSRPRLFDAVPRERVFRRLDDVWHHPAVWIASPAGAGKTTLVASYLEHRRIPDLWYQLDSGDADVATFFVHLARAGMRYGRGDHDFLPLFTAEFQHDVLAFARRFFRDLFARLPRRTAVVFDNYQDVSPHSPLQGVIADVLREIPEHVLVILISREDPPAHFARHRANQWLGTLGWDALRLTAEETESIARLKGCDAPAVQEALHRVCGGWTAGLILMLERSLHGDDAQAPESVVSRESVFDYFAGEILDRSPVPTQRFLVESALLPRFSVPMAAALTGNADAGRLLEDLYRRHLFLDRRQGAELTYEYHALFRAFLLHRIGGLLSEADMAVVGTRAASLLESTGQFDDAFLLYCRHAGWDSAETLFIRQAPRLVAQGRGRTLRDWADQLPENRRSANPWIAYWVGQSFSHQDRDDACRWLETAHAAFSRQANGVGVLLSAAAIIASFHFDWTDFHALDPWIPVLEAGLLGNAAALDASDELDVSAALLTSLIFRKADSGRLGELATRVVVLLERPGETNRRMNAATQVLSYCYLAGEFDLPDRVCAVVRRLLEDPEVNPYAVAFWYARLAVHQWRLNRLDECRSACEESVRLCEKYGFDAQLSWCLLTRMYLAGLDQDVPSMERSHAKVREIARRQRTQDLYFEAIFGATIAMYRGDFALATQCCRQAVAVADRSGSARVVSAGRAWLASALAQNGQLGEARRVVAEATARLHGTPFRALTTQLALIGIVILLQEGDEAAARKRLDEVLSDTDALADVSEFIIHGRHVLTATCEAAFRFGIRPEAARSLVQRFQLTSDDPTLEEWPWHVRLNTLGRFSVLVGGRPPSSRGRSPVRLLGLLKCLVAAGPGGQAAISVAEQLWPMAEGDAAAQNLDVAVSRLRRFLRLPQAITWQDQRVGLNSRYCWVDAWAFAAIARGAENPNAGHAQREALARTAVQLYAGPFVEVDDDPPCLAAAREALKRQWLNVGGSLADRLASTGRHNEARDLCEGLLERDPLVEAVYRRLIRLHLEAGDAASARTAYLRCRAALQTHLGVGTSADTEALARAAGFLKAN